LLTVTLPVSRGSQRVYIAASQLPTNRERGERMNRGLIILVVVLVVILLVVLALPFVT
jgi:hypothetical protein